MDAADAVYETVVFPFIDGSVTFVLHPIRDFIELPLLNWWNDMINYRVWDTFDETIDDSVATGDNDTLTTTQKVNDIVTQWADWLLVDVAYAPTNTSDARWGPMRVTVPFVHWFIKSVNSWYAGGIEIPFPSPPFGSSFILTLKNITMTFVRLDVLSKSCYFQHFLTWDGSAWALDNCYLFDTAFCPDTDDHLHGTCPHCHNTSSAAFDSYATAFVDGWAIIAREFVEELVDVVHSSYIDMCDVLEGATCTASATYGDPPTAECACSGFNCSLLPWWVKPPSMLGSHCPEGQLQPIGMPLFGDHDCNPLAVLRAQCGNPSIDYCSIVPESSRYSYVFRGKTCYEVSRAGGLISGRSCTFKSPCEIRDWSWWLERVVNITADLSVDAFRAIGKSLSCEWDYLRSWFAVIVLASDKRCTYGAFQDWVSFLQTIFYRLPPIANSLICITPMTDFLLQFKLEPLSTGLRDISYLYLRVLASIFDGSILTRSCYYCTAPREPDRNCGILARTLYTTCTTIDPWNVRITGATCASVGFMQAPGQSGCWPLPCYYSAPEVCAFFFGSLCFDTNHTIDPAIAVGIHAMDLNWMLPHPGWCDPFDSGQWAISGPEKMMFANCNTFAGCNATNCHTYTRDLWSILNTSLYQTGYNVLTLMTVSPDDARKTMAFWESYTVWAACEWENWKSLIGEFILLGDSGCSAGPTQEVDWFINQIIGGGISCWSALGDFFGNVGSEWLRIRVGQYIDDLRTLLPDIWNGYILSSNSYYCNIWPKTDIAGDVVSPPAGTVVHWAFQGCHGFGGGLCDAVWQANSPWQEGEGDIPMEFGDPYADLLLALGADYRDIFRMFLIAVGAGDTIADLLSDPIYEFYQWIVDITLNWVRNLVGSLMLLFDTSCYYGMTQGHVAEQFEYHFTYTFIWEFNSLIRFLTRLFTTFWDIIGPMFMALLRKIGVFRIIIDAATDISTMAVCFGDNMNASGNSQQYVSLPAYVPNFMACARAWPGAYLPYGGGCALHVCWDRAWLCVLYNDSTVSPKPPRTYNWFGQMFATVPIGRAVSGILSVVDSIVCRFNCLINYCSLCGWKIAKLPACVVACLKPPYTYADCGSTDIRLEAPDRQIAYFRVSVYQYGCTNVCFDCEGDRDAYWECLAECVLSHGAYDTTIDWLLPIPYPDGYEGAPPYLDLSHMQVPCSRHLSVDGVLAARWAHQELAGNYHNLDRWNQFPAPFNQENPSYVYGLLTTLMSWGWDPAASDPAMWAYEPNTACTPTWPYIGKPDPDYAWWTYKAILAEDFCTGACAASQVYHDADSTQQIEYYMACRAFHTFIRINQDVGPMPYNDSTPHDDCNGEWTKDTLVLDHAGWGGVHDVTFANAWCGGLTLYSMYDHGGANLTAFQDMMCWPQLYEADCGEGNYIPRLLYGEPEVYPALARVLWLTYLSPMHKPPSLCQLHDLPVDSNYDFSGGSDYDQYTHTRNNLASCRQTAWPADVWNPTVCSDHPSNRLLLGRSLYDWGGQAVMGQPDAEFWHCTQGTWSGSTYTPGPNNIGVASHTSDGYVKRYVDDALGRDWTETRPQLQKGRTATRFPPRLPTPTEIRAAEAGGKRSDGVRDADYRAAVKAYHTAMESGTVERPYRDPDTFAARIASAKHCPDVTAATGTPGCYCGTYLLDCTAAITKYGPQGSGSLLERIAFRYCSRAWDAFENAPDATARVAAKNLLCIDDSGTPVADRFGSLLSAVLEPAPGFGGANRILGADSLLGSDTRAIFEYARRAFNVTALKSGAAGFFGKLADSYSGSWLQKSLAAGMELRNRHGGADPTAEEELGWEVDTLRGLSVSMAPAAEVRLRSLATRPRVGLAHGSRHETDSKGRSPLAALVDSMLEISERDLERARRGGGGATMEPILGRVFEAAGYSKTATAVLTAIASSGAALRDTLSRAFWGEHDPVDRAKLSRKPGEPRLTSGTRALLAEGRRSPYLARNWTASGAEWVVMDFTPQNRPINETVFSFFRSAISGVGSKYGPAFSELAANAFAESGLNGTVLRVRRLAAGAVALTNFDAIFDWIGSRVKHWIQSAGSSGIIAVMKDFGNYLLRVVTCVYPLQVNTTRPYNVFCLPRFPEGWMSTVPMGPFEPAQILWAPELVAQNCTNPDYPDRGPYTNPGYPDQILYGRYWYMHQNPCNLHDGQNRPGCPGSRWCEKVHSAENVPIDLVDCLLVLIDRLAGLVYRILYPNIGSGVTSVDRLHWLINFAMIIFPLPWLWKYFPYVGTLSPIIAQLCWLLAIWYSWASGVLVHGVILYAVHVFGTLVYTFIYWAIFIPFFLYGGFSWAYPNLIGWATTAICSVTDTGFFWWFPYLPELCYRLTRIEGAMGTAVYQMWLLYFGKTVLALLLLYLLFSAVVTIAAAVVWYSLQFFVSLWNLYTVYNVQRRLGAIDRNVLAAQTLVPGSRKAGTAKLAADASKRKTD
jgi:hypothetical protein